jgi:hypothetical protein
VQIEQDGLRAIDREARDQEHALALEDGAIDAVLEAVDAGLEVLVLAWTDRRAVGGLDDRVLRRRWTHAMPQQR